MPPPVVTNFTCRGREMGFYADLELKCRVYHNCDEHGNKFTYYCPIDTAFRQEAMVCDHAHLVKCQSVEENSPDNRGQSNFQRPEFAPFSVPQNSERRSFGFSRSFRIGQDNAPSNSVQNKNPNFVLSSSVFFGNQNNTFKNPTNLQNKGFTFPITKPPFDFSRSTINKASSFPTKRIPSSTIRPFSGKSFTVKDSFNQSPIQDFDSDFLQPPPMRNDNVFRQFSTSSPKPEGRFINFETQNNKFPSQNQENKEKERPDTFFLNREEMQVFPKSKSRPYMFLEPPLFKGGKTSSVDFTTKSPFDFRSPNYPYMETLRSIQREARTDHPLTTTTRRPATTRPTIRTTESPFALLTASLEPLVPNEVEHDPYYPKFPTSTEIYYTPRDLGKDSKSLKLSTRKLPTDLNLRIPSVLPDLNSLEDLVDRRKIFYIPKSRSA